MSLHCTALQDTDLELYSLCIVRCTRLVRNGITLHGSTGHVFKTVFIVHREVH